MLTRLLFTALLEGLRPRSSRLRRPVPIVSYDHVTEPRATVNLRRLAAEWSATAAEYRRPEPVTVEIPERADARATVADLAGWAGVVLSRVA